MIGVLDRATPAGPPRRSQRWLIAAVLVVVMLLLAWVIGYSSVLGARTITVKGNHALSAAQIRQAAGVRAGTPLLRLDKQRVQSRVAALPDIRTVTVSTSYPSTVTITVTERVAVAYRTSGAAAVLLDRDNVAFRSVTALPVGLPRVEVGADDARSAAAALVAGSLPAMVAKQVSLIRVPTTESITLMLGDGRTILWGGTDRSGDKAKLLQALLGQPGTYFDLSDPDAVISRGAPSGN